MLDSAAPPAGWLEQIPMSAGVLAASPAEPPSLLSSVAAAEQPREKRACRPIHHPSRHPCCSAGRSSGRQLPPGISCAPKPAGRRCLQQRQPPPAPAPAAAASFAASGASPPLPPPCWPAAAGGRGLRRRCGAGGALSQRGRRPSATSPCCTSPSTCREERAKFKGEKRVRREDSAAAGCQAEACEGPSLSKRCTQQQRASPPANNRHPGTIQCPFLPSCF
jgi:hypothetical protein